MRVRQLLLLCAVFCCTLAKLTRDEQYVYDLTEAINTLTQHPDFNQTWETHKTLFGGEGVPQPALIKHCPVRARGKRPTSVHTLRPEDVDVIGSIGDSLTAGNGVSGKNIFEVLLQVRGKSWSSGGDDSLDQGVITLTNILRHFNPNIKGYGRYNGFPFEDSAWLNQAVMGSRATRTDDLLDQAKEVVTIMEHDHRIDVSNDWKVFTLLIGGNDMCGYCKDRVGRSPSVFRKGVEDALDYLQEHSPRTLVNVVPLMDLSPLKEIGRGDIICELLQERFCSCLLNDETAPEFKPLQNAYARVLEDLVNSGKYDTIDDFTVVLQPYLWEQKFPRGADGKPDASFLSPDCFHPSRKTHEQLAMGLYKGMLEPHGKKGRGQDPRPDLKLPCPSAEHPYIFTKKNSKVGGQEKPPVFDMKAYLKSYVGVKPNWEQYEKNLQGQRGRAVQGDIFVEDKDRNDEKETSLGKADINGAVGPATYSSMVVMLSLMVMAVVVGSVVLGVVKYRGKKAEREQVQPTQSFDNPVYVPQ